jgi:hypothetical protein
MITTEESCVYGGNFSLSVDLSSVREGLDYILRHFDCDNDQPLWPRTISTKLTEGRQIPVNSKEEALDYYRKANFLDCKISGYPKYKKGFTKVAPSLIFIDLDQAKIRKILDKQLENTLQNINNAFGNNEFRPTVLWSGKGYHIYIPVAAFVLENEEIFQVAINPSRKFLQWSEQYLSCNKADLCHTIGLSFNNCMLRIPNSINSKSNQQVRLIQSWNGVTDPNTLTTTNTEPIRPDIRPLLYEFYIHLADLKFNEIIGIDIKTRRGTNNSKYSRYWNDN